MDGVLVDWDAGFRKAWQERSDINRSNYHMEECVPSYLKSTAEEIIRSRGFFESLPPMRGGIESMREMLSEGLRVYICTSPIISSDFCAQEKLSWVRKHLGKYKNHILLYLFVKVQFFRRFVGRKGYTLLR